MRRKPVQARNSSRSRRPPVRAAATAESPWQSHARHLVLAAGGLAAAGTLWGMVALLARSDAPPLAGIARVDGVVVNVDQDRMKFLQRIEALGEAQKQFGEWQSAQIADTLANRLRNLQSSIDVAKARYEQSRATEDLRILETLQMQLDSLQRQIRERAQLP